MIPYAKLLKRVTNITTPFLGISWEAPNKSEKDIAQEIILVLEDRRFLYSPFDNEEYSWVVDSIFQTREKLNEILANEHLDKTSVLANCLIAMRAACRNFLEKVSKKSGRPIETGFDSILALGELRAQIGISILQISVTYHIDLPDSLEGILPPPP